MQGDADQTCAPLLRGDSGAAADGDQQDRGDRLPCMIYVLSREFYRHGGFIDERTVRRGC
jgi:hypothetical protein